MLEMYCVYALNAQQQLRMQWRMQHFFSPGRLTINLSSVFFKWFLCVVSRLTECPRSSRVSLTAAVIHPGDVFSGF